MDIAGKILKIEALIVGAKSDGERQAAEFAKQRLQEKITAQPIEYTVRVNSFWKKRLFVAICNKHGLRTYRYARQKYTTTMVRVAAPFMDLVLWPDYQKYATILDTLSEEILCDLTSQISCIKEEETVIAGEIPFNTEKAAL
ncbi:MAG TPA: hypothetical protein DCY54_04320 [Parachlamydiales bacterium]|nr:MAG: hypothetical protein A3I15_01965 [Chlamydiae bacterium RIFCSPLOWO2_02_FULL_49_12]HAZ15838.1 hypothetical protein [Parachlamydiales bacterium]